MNESKTWWIEQLKEHLEFMQELGIDAISAEVLNSMKKPTVSPRRSPAVSTILEPMPKDKQKKIKQPAPLIIEPSMTTSPLTSPFSTLEALRGEIGDCHRCKLCNGRTNIVFGSGNPLAKLVFVGEGPGADEDAQGLPFVGKAGQLLTKIIESIQMTRDEVYICNVVKCRPPNNRVPEKDEVAACSPFMRAQLGVIRPKVICCLGATAAQTLLETTAFLGKLRGRFYDFHGSQLIVTYHPAYLLRNPAAKRDVWEDMKKIRSLMESEKEAGRW
jgi:uracil-DNA glycosylase family 4